MEVVQNLITVFKTRDLDLAKKYFIISHNDSITNQVREYLDSLKDEELTEIQHFLYKLLNICYGNKLFDNSDEKLNLTEEDLFLLKENVIYYIGRLKVLPEVDILKKAYYLENNKHVKLNLAFTSLMTFDEEIELDFIKLFTYGNEYDVMLRSWTMAFFANSDNPYDYIDNINDDWNRAKMPRIMRLNINNQSDPKYEKAMSFRLFDLLVLDLFLENRNESLTEEEKIIVENADINYSKYSDAKIKLLKELKQKIILR